MATFPSSITSLAAHYKYDREESIAVLELKIGTFLDSAENRTTIPWLPIV
jgi:hypothetical protein